MRRDSHALLEGKVVVVTGAARGIGSAIATAAAREGAKVAILDILSSGQAVAKDLVEQGGTAVFHRADVSREDDVRSALAATVEELGTIDAVVNNAGVNADFEVTSMTEEEWETFFGIDLKASWLTSKYALPYLVEGGGAIVNISSIHARLSSPGNFPYAAAKAGLEGLTRSLALEYGSRNVRVNAVAPGFTRTEGVQLWLDEHPDPVAADRDVCARHPLGRMAAPAEVADVVVFLASDLAGAVTGAVVPVDCGHSISTG